MLDYIAMQIRRTNREKGCTWLSVDFLFLLVKCVLECSVDLNWGCTSAPLNYERFLGY